ncbi:hypothetical protein ACLK2C_06820 [Escherichia coli]
MHVCGHNPNCDGYEIEEGEFRLRAMTGRSLSASDVEQRCS